MDRDRELRLDHLGGDRGVPGAHLRDSLSPCVVGIAAALLLVSACATLAPRLEGRSEILAWQATDLTLEQKTVGGPWYYTFELLVREVRGAGLTFNEIETTLYQPGTIPWSARYRGTWRLDANDQFRIPLGSTLACHPGSVCSGPNVPIPLWQIRMKGTDDGGQTATTVIDLSLPADPPSPPVTTSKSVRGITLVPPKAPQTPTR